MLVITISGTGSRSEALLCFLSFQRLDFLHLLIQVLQGLAPLPIRELILCFRGAQPWEGWGTGTPRNVAQIVVVAVVSC